MKSIELLTIGIRLVGIFLIISGTQHIVQSFQIIPQLMTWSDDETSSQWVVYFTLAYFVVYFLVAAALIKFPATIAKKLLPAEVRSEDANTISGKGLEVALVSVLGIYILSWAIPDLFDNTLMLLYFRQGDALFYGPQFNELYIKIFVTLVEIAIGLFLCLRVKGLIALLYKIRGS